MRPPPATSCDKRRINHGDVLHRLITEDVARRRRRRRRRRRGLDWPKTQSASLCFFLLSFFVFFCHLLRKPKTSAETESIKKITQKKGKKRNGGSKYQVERIASASCKLSLDSFRLITELSSRCFVTYGRHSFFCFVSFCLF